MSGEERPSVDLKDVDRVNFRECVEPSVAAAQDRFVAPNVYSIAQAKVEPECVPLAVYHKDGVVGSAMYALDREEGVYWVYRLMVGASEQGKGYGRAAMEKLISAIREDPECDEISISYEPDNEAARKLYASLNFEETGEVIEDDAVARLRFRTSAPPAVWPDTNNKA